MDLEKINAEYIELKSKLKELESNVEKWLEEIDDLKDNKDITKGRAAFYRKEGRKAQEENDLAKAEECKKQEQEANKEAEELDKKLEETRRIVKQKAEEVRAVKNHINNKINELRQNPEIKEYINKSLQEKYSRRIEILKEQKAQQLNKAEENKKGLYETRDKICKIQEVLAKNQTITFLIERLSSNTLKANGIGEEYDGINPESVKAHDLKREANKKVKLYKDDLGEIFKELGIDIEIAEMLTFIGGNVKVMGNKIEGLALTPDGKIDVAMEINKALKSVEQEIAKIDKKRDVKIAKIDKNLLRNTMTLSEINAARTKKTVVVKKTTTQKDNSKQPKGENNKNGFWKSFNWRFWRKKQTLPEPQVNLDSHNDEKKVPDEKRYNQDNNTHNEKKVPDEKKYNPDNNTHNEEKKDFMEALKYEIVQDAYRMEKEDIIKRVDEKFKDENAPEDDRNR